MDYFTVPQICSTVRANFEPVLRSLDSLGDILDITYQLWQHPVLQNWKGYQIENPFFQEKNQVENFNPTLIERTIMEARYYGRMQFSFGSLALSSSGYERAIASIESFVLSAKKIFELSDQELSENSTEVHFFRLTKSGELTALVRYLMDCCLSGILLSRKTILEQHLSELESDADKKIYLLKSKKELEKSRKECYPKIYADLMELIRLESEFLDSKPLVHSNDPDLQSLVAAFFKQQKARISSKEILDTLVKGQIKKFHELLAQLVLSVFSYHDIGGQDQEKVYHAFLIGLLNDLVPLYQLKSNRESGLGRFDIMLIPQDKKERGFIFEIKKSKSENSIEVNALLDESLQQIQSNKYYHDLAMEGIVSFYAIAIAFYGKQIFMKYEIYSLS